MADEEGFLNRWSRRKLAERTSPEPGEDQPGTPAAQTDETPLPEAEGAPTERHPTEDIDIDALTGDSDFTVFMAKGVPSAVKRRALRKLWTTNPALAGLDGLNDYFDLEKPKTHGLGPMGKTKWKIGRGFLTEEQLAPPPRRAGEAPEESRDEIAAQPEAAPEQTADQSAASDSQGEVETSQGELETGARVAGEDTENTPRSGEA